MKDRKLKVAGTEYVYTRTPIYTGWHYRTDINGLARASLEVSKLLDALCCEMKKSEALKEEIRILETNHRARKSPYDASPAGHPNLR